MRFIKRTVLKIMRWAAKDDINESSRSIRDIEPAKYAVGSIVGSRHMNQNTDISENNNGMNFTVYSAIGGKVIQIRSYEPTRDRHNSTLYVVTDTENLGEELGQIITRESLSR